MGLNLNLNCVVLSGGSKNSCSNPQIFNFAAEFFVEYWNRHFNNLGISKNIDLKEFSQQERVVSIFSGPKIVAMLTLNGHSMKAADKRSSYFGQFSSDFLSLLPKMNLGTVQSVQWLMVSRHLPPELNGIPLAEIIISLALKYQTLLGFDASVALARMDNACAHVAQKLGFVMHCQPVQLYNSPIAQLLCQNPRSCNKPGVAALVERLWQQRDDAALVNSISDKVA